MKIVLAALIGAALFGGCKSERLKISEFFVAPLETRIKLSNGKQYVFIGKEAREIDKLFISKGLDLTERDVREYLEKSQLARTQ